MKRLILIALLLATGTLWAQDVVRDSVPPAADSIAVDIDDNDTVDDEENVIGVRRQPRSKEQREANILGAPVYYDSYGNVIGSGETSEVYHRPKHHYLNNLNDRFCNFFLEGELLTGRHDHAVGASFTYLPKRWGFYGSALVGTHHTYLSMGAALRLSDYDTGLDWQIYAGLGGGGRHLGGEAGVRVAPPKYHGGEFCWTSLSLGLANYGGYSFLTFGASLDLMAAMAATFILFW